MYRIITLVLILMCSFCVFYCTRLDKGQSAPNVIHDTINITKFETKIKEVPVYYYDTIFNNVFVSSTTNDTIKIIDTLRIPIETNETSFNIKKDSFEVNGIITHSGFKSTIENIELDYKYTLPKQKKPRKWHIALQGGFGVQYGLIKNEFDVGPYIGLGVSYDLW